MAEQRAGVYSIGVVARLTGLHEQTIRQYERLGLVSPQRSPGGTRMFSDLDVARLSSIASLTRDLGVNLAGAEIILRMRERQEQLLSLVRELLQQMDEASRARIESFLRGDEPGLVPRGRQHLAVQEERPQARRIDIEEPED